MNKKISLIIPSQASKFYLEDYLLNILFWTYKPNEIIIVNTYKKIRISSEIKNKFKKKNIDVRVLNKKNFYPGQARNIGIKASKFEILCFLDMNTVIYNFRWLELNLKYMFKKKIDGLLGQTKYLANNNKEKLIIASTYGFKLLKTLPGSIIKKEIFNKLGFFNNYTRAGEDTEWLLRIKKKKYKFLIALEPIFYKGLYNVSYVQIIKKWFRNYYSSAVYKHLFVQKIIYISVFLLSLLTIFYEILLIFFKTNSSFDSFLINFLIILSLSYIVFRGIFLPLKKNVKFYFLFPINFIKIIFFSFCLDMVKTLSFIMSLFKINRYPEL